MEAAQAEPSRSLLGWFSRPEPADETVRHCWVIAGSAGALVPVTRVVDFNQGSGRMKRLLDVTLRAQRTVAVLDGLDEHADADRPLTPHFAGNGRRDPVSRAYTAWVGLFVQCRSSHDAMRAGSSAHPGILFPGDCTLPPGLVCLSACETDVSASAAAGVDAEIGAHWRALPPYSRRPFALHPCCGAGALSSEATTAAGNPERLAGRVPAIAEPFGSLPEPFPVLPDSPLSTSEQLLSTADLLPGFVRARMFDLVAPITATVRDERFVRDYREGLRRFLGGVLALLHRMVVTLLAALAHLARMPAFLLVMLATARRYGRRGDGDGHYVPAPTWHPIPVWGAARPAA